MKLYKVLDKNGNSCNGGKYKWSLPKQNADGTWTPGEWADPIEGELTLCENGYHVCNSDQLIKWLNSRVFEVEVEGEVVHGDNKAICRKCRLTKEFTNWNERTARLFACDCAERVLHVFEKLYPENNSPRIAIETARRYANGKATNEELAAAHSTAVSAAAYAASADAAYAAASADAAYAASAAAAYAAADAAYAASAAAYARSAEREWQIKRLKKLLEE